MEIIFYSTHCPRCKVLEQKLKQKNIQYTECNDMEEMENREITSVPCLSVDGNILEFGSAVKWVNEQEA